MRKITLITLISLLFVSSFAAIGVSNGYTYVPPFNQSTSLPSFSFVNQNFTVYVNETFGFSNYTLTAYIGGDNFTGSSQQSSLHYFQAANPDFTFNITAPGINQKIYIEVVAAAEYNGVSVTKSKSYTVIISQPIVFHAQIVNKGIATVNNLTVNFYLDNAQFPSGHVTVTSIAPNQIVDVNFTYPFESLTRGEHSLTVTTTSTAINVNGNSGTSTSHFYYGTPPNYDWIYYVAIVVIIVMSFFVFSAGRRPAAGMRPPKWRRNK